MCSTSKDIETKELCAICYEDLSKDIKKLSCSHYFHTKCIDVWLNKNNTCPCCRTYVLREENIHNMTLSSSTQILSPSTQIRYIIFNNNVVVYRENSTQPDWQLCKIDIDLVVSQYGESVTFEQALRALINHDNDIVDAIMYLTM